MLEENQHHYLYKYTHLALSNIIDILLNNKRLRLSIRYINMETKEALRIGYNGFLFPREYPGEGGGAYNNDVIFYRIKNVVRTVLFVYEFT